MVTDFMDEEADVSGPDCDLSDNEALVAEDDGFIDDQDDEEMHNDTEVDMHQRMDFENSLVLAQKDQEEAERLQERFSSQMSATPTPTPVAHATPVARPAPVAATRPPAKEVTASFKPVGPQVRPECFCIWHASSPNIFFCRLFSCRKSPASTLLALLRPRLSLQCRYGWVPMQKAALLK